MKSYVLLKLQIKFAEFPSSQFQMLLLCMFSSYFTIQTINVPIGVVYSFASIASVPTIPSDPFAKNLMVENVFMLTPFQSHLLLLCTHNRVVLCFVLGI